jgi:hypothetical protein
MRAGVDVSDPVEIVVEAVELVGTVLVAPTVLVVAPVVVLPRSDGGFVAVVVLDAEVIVDAEVVAAFAEEPSEEVALERPVEALLVATVGSMLAVVVAADEAVGVAAVVVAVGAVFVNTCSVDAVSSADVVPIS